MENPTIEQTMAETGLGRTQINRFIGLGSLTKISPDRLTRDSVDAIKRCYSLPPRREGIPTPSGDIPNPDSMISRARRLTKITGFTTQEAMFHLQGLRLPVQVERTYMDRLEGYKGAALDVVKCCCGMFILTPVGAQGVCPKCLYLKDVGVAHV